MMRPIAILLAASLAAACVDAEDDQLLPDTSAEALTASVCTGTVTTSGSLPSYSTFWGILPGDVAGTQVWVMHPLDAAQNEFALYQVDLAAGRVAWRSRMNRVQRSLALVMLGGRSGRVGSVRDVPPPPAPGPGQTWLKFVVAYAKGVHVAYDAAGMGSNCMGDVTPTAPMPAPAPFFGVLPADLAGPQAWGYMPNNADGSEVLAFRIDLGARRIDWTALLPVGQLPVLNGALGGSYKGWIWGVRGPRPQPLPPGQELLNGYLLRLGYASAFAYVAALEVGGLSPYR